ncbi:hypothetical protein E2320_012030 [Naja naja]|nr:hypothetical protein E2320_012030 [Naja naja]
MTTKRKRKMRQKRKEGKRWNWKKVLSSFSDEDASTEVSPSFSNTKDHAAPPFAERISHDIQRYFGKKNKEQEEEGRVEESSCKTYEDSLPPPLSGQATSYTDLIRTSQCLQRHLSPDNKKLMWLERKFAHVTPMQSRKLPQSFWREPMLSPIGTPNGNPPDFSDLLANWTSESGQEELNASREHLGDVTGDGH